MFDRDSLHDLRSLSKSVTSALLGIAIGSDYEQVFETPVTQYFPNLQTSPQWEAVTLHHALTMTAGIEWNEITVPYTDETNDEIRLYAARDPVAMVLSRPVITTPGAVWYYNGGLSQLLAAIVQKVKGQRLDT